MPALGTFSLGSVGLPSTLVRGAPTVEITSPGTVVSTATFTTTWTYTSPTGRAQDSYRVRLQNVDRTFTFYDSGSVESTDDFFAVPFVLSGATTYTLIVEVYDGLDWSVPASRAIEYQSNQWAGGTLDEPKVGSVYEIAINGVGLMLADHPEQGESYRRQAAQLDPQRFATGDTPFSEAIERYTFIGHAEWSGGEGQEYRDRERSLATRYDYSEGLDPFEPGQITCLPKMELVAPSDSSDQPLIRTALPGALGYLAPVEHWWFKSDTQELTEWDGTTATSFDPGGAILSMASDGFYWYVSSGSDIYRNSTASTGSVWSTVDTANIYWAADRLVGIPFNDADTLVTFDPAGAVVDTFAHPDCRVWGATGGDGYLWYGVLRGARSEVRAWQLDNQDEQPFVAFTLPEGETLMQLFFYLGNVFIATVEGRIYRCIPNEGRLTASVVVDEDVFVGVGGFSGNGNKVAFTWTNMELDDSAGIGVIDLSTGGYARWLSSENATPMTTADGIAPYGDDFCFTVRDEGLYIPTDDYRAGLIRTSVSDLASGTQKVFDEVRLSTQPLNGQIEVLYSIDSNQTFHSVGVADSQGTLSRTLPLGVRAEAIGLELRFTPATLAPVLLIAQVKLHPVGLVDQLVSFVVNAANRQNGLNGQELPESGPQRGRQIARWLESLLATSVRYQDIDWPVTRSSQTFQVMSVDYRPIGVFNRHLNRREDGGVVLVSMRRAL